MMSLLFILDPSHPIPICWLALDFPKLASLLPGQGSEVIIHTPHGCLNISPCIRNYKMYLINFNCFHAWTKQFIHVSILTISIWSKNKQVQFINHCCFDVNTIYMVAMFQAQKVIEHCFKRTQKDPFEYLLKDRGALIYWILLSVLDVHYVSLLY